VIKILKQRVNFLFVAIWVKWVVGLNLQDNLLLAFGVKHSEGRGDTFCVCLFNLMAINDEILNLIEQQMLIFGNNILKKGLLWCIEINELKLYARA